MKGAAAVERPSCGGFGLIEVLVALVVLSSGLLAAAGLAVTAEKERRLAARETERSLVAQLVLDSVRRAGYGAAVDGRTTVRPAGRPWTASWEVTVLAPGLKSVRVTVPGRAGDLPLSLATRLHGPRSAAGASAGAPD